MKSGSGCKVNISIFSGGVGGAKLARGFVKAFAARDISIITNTADDTEFYGLYVCPDLDTMMYTLAGLSDKKRGWGIQDDSFETLGQLGKLGEATWFNLGDKDLATHILRTRMLRGGATLTEVTSYLCEKLSVCASILPMTDQRVQTLIKTDRETIPFQEYFVLRQKKVNIKGVIFKGLRRAFPTPEVIEAIKGADLIVFGPSNPVVSILPILGLSGLKRALFNSTATKIAVSPFLRKKAISGPAKELMKAKGFEGSSIGAARFYSKLIDILFIHPMDEKEKVEIEKTGIVPVLTETIMRDADDSVELAKKIFDAFQAQTGRRG
jgi:LPPG:FO 2-phospho-L-lactate transferase